MTLIPALRMVVKEAFSSTSHIFQPWSQWRKKSESKVALDDSALRQTLKDLELRAYKTYRARQSAANRLHRRAQAWNWALVSFSTATTIAAVGMLTQPDMYGANGDSLMACLAILVLVASLTTANLDYSGRSRDMFLNYRKIQRISVEMEALASRSTPPLSATAVDEMSARYQSILDETENHTSGDHLRHFSKDAPKGDLYYTEDVAKLRQRRRAMISDGLVTWFPCATLTIPIALLIPLVRALAS